MSKKKIPIKVSIVVPIYNIEHYIKRCVDSLIQQSYADLEIILIDDESTDRSGKICNEYAQKDTRIQVIHKKNGGLSDARNAGIVSATGEYIAFIDGDDYIATDFIKVLLNTALNKNADIAVCGCYKEYKGSRLVGYTPHSVELNNIDAVKDLFVRPDIYKVVTWNKLYKRSLFEKTGVTFPKGKIHEDNYTTYKLFFYANKVAYVDKALYYYIQRDDSIMGREFNDKRLDVLDMFAEAKEFFTKHNVNISKELEVHRLLVTMGLYNDFLASKGASKEIGMRLRAELKKMRSVLMNDLVTVKHKILYLLTLHTKFLYKYLRQRYEAARK